MAGDVTSLEWATHLGPHLSEPDLLSLLVLYFRACEDHVACERVCTDLKVSAVGVHFLLLFLELNLKNAK